MLLLLSALPLLASSVQVEISTQDLVGILEIRDSALARLSFDATVSTERNGNVISVTQHSVWYKGTRLLEILDGNGNVVEAFREDHKGGEKYRHSSDGKPDRHTIGLEYCKELRSADNAESFGLWPFGLSGLDWFGDHAQIYPQGEARVDGVKTIEFIRSGSQEEESPSSLWRFFWDPETMLFRRFELLSAWPKGQAESEAIDHILFQGQVFGVIQRWDCESWLFLEELGVSVPTAGSMKVVPDPLSMYPGVHATVKMRISPLSIKFGDAVDASSTSLNKGKDFLLEDTKFGLVFTPEALMLKNRAQYFQKLCLKAGSWNSVDYSQEILATEVNGEEIPCGLSAAFLLLLASGKEIDFSQFLLENRAMASEDWMSVESLIGILEVELPTTPYFLESKEELKDIEGPFVMLIDPAEDAGGHYVVCRSNENGVEILDPLQEYAFLDWARLQEIGKEWIFLLPSNTSVLKPAFWPRLVLFFTATFLALFFFMSRRKATACRSANVLLLPLIVSSFFGCSKEHVDVGQTSGPLVALGGPRVVFEKVEPNSKIAHTFELQNHSAKTIRISEVKASCGCSSTELDRKEVLPGDWVTLTATVQMEMVGGKEVVIALYEEGQGHLPIIQLFISAQIEATGIIIPEGPGITINDIIPDVPFTASVGFKFFHRGAPLVGLVGICPVPGIHVSIECTNSRVDLGNPGVTIQSFEISLSGQLTHDRIRELETSFLEVSGESQSEKVTQVIPILGLVGKDFVPSPKSVILMKAAGPRTVQLFRAPFSKARLSLDNLHVEGISLSLLEVDNGSYELSLQVESEQLPKNSTHKLVMPIQGGLDDNLVIPILVRG